MGSFEREKLLASKHEIVGDPQVLGKTFLLA
jgi:hypothetical protein